MSQFNGYNPRDLQVTLRYVVKDIEKRKAQKKKIPDSLKNAEVLLRRELARSPNKS